MSILRYETSPAWARQRVGAPLSADAAFGRFVCILGGTPLGWMMWLAVAAGTSDARLAALLMGGLFLLPLAGLVLMLKLVSWPLAVGLRRRFSTRLGVVLLLSLLGQALLGLGAVAVWQLLTAPTSGDFHF
ncbi:hypothetical protein GCM10027048_29540 [Hymenobacter coalescens]